jgi:hypothetical protein
MTPPKLDSVDNNPVESWTISLGLAAIMIFAATIWAFVSVIFSLPRSHTPYIFGLLTTGVELTVIGTVLTIRERH